MPQSKPAVFIVDDDEAVRKGLSKLMESVGLCTKTFESAQAFLDSYDPSQAGCLLLDVRMPGMSGLRLHDILVEKGVTIPVIFITGHGDLSMAVEAVKKGAFDFLEKPVGDQKLLDKIQEAIAEDGRLRQKQSEQKAVAAKLSLLTAREHEVLDGIMEGKANKIIAAELAISESTVERHRASIMEKMQVNSVARLVTLVNSLET